MPGIRPWVVLLGFFLLSGICLCVVNNATHKRDKRHLIFYQSGTYKLVIGIAIPVKLGMKQSMAVGLNFQYQYGQATNITQLEKPYPPIIAKSRERRQTGDNGRTLFYLGLESALNSYGLNGKECLLKSICENGISSTKHDANGLFGQLVHIALTPLYGEKNPGSLDPIYVDAQKAGQFGVDCVSLFPECPQGIGIMDIMTVLDN